MKIETVPVTLRVLRPTGGDNWLTNGETFSQEVYLGEGADPEGWREVSEETMREMQAEIDAKAQIGEA